MTQSPSSPEGGDGDGGDGDDEEEEGDFTDEDVALGEGFNSATGQGTGESCLGAAGAIDGTALEFVDSRSYFAEMLHTQEDIERKLTGRTEGDVDAGQFEAGFESELDSEINSHEEQQLLTVGLHLRTISRYLELNQNYQRNNLCDGGHDYADFHGTCGDKYNNREWLGGYCMFTADITNWDRDEQLAVKNEFSLGAGPVSGGFKGDWESAETESGKDLRFDVSCLGIEDPSSSFLDSDGKMKPDGYYDYLDELRRGCDESESGCDSDDAVGYADAYDAGKEYHSSYGAILERELLSYKKGSFVEWCLDRDLGEGEECHEEFFNDYRKDYKDVESNADDAAEKLDNESDYYWGENKSDAKQEWVDFEQDASACKDDWSDAATDCLDALYAPEPKEEICLACTAPQDCGGEEIDARHNGLPPVETHASRIADVETENIAAGGSVHISQVDDELCTLSRVTGRLQSADDRVVLEKSNDQWHFYASQSPAADSDATLEGTASCVPTANFTDGTGGDFIVEDTYTNDIHPTGGAEWGVVEYPFVAPVSGVGGHFEGGGEYVKLLFPTHTANNHQGEWEMALNTESSDHVHGWTTPFGLENPDGGEPGFVDKQEYELQNFNGALSEGDHQEGLAPSEEAHCFLTEVSGEFDGKGERASVYTEEGLWYLEISAACDKKKAFSSECKEAKPIKASAQCVPYDQSN